jgi:Trk K+ transport system NAD-binding subunit
MIAAREAYNILKLPSAVNIETFSARSIEMMEVVVRPESKLKG